jgi:hypothetical protein
MKREDYRQEQLAYKYLLGEDVSLLQYTSPLGNWATIQARGTRNTSLQPPQLQQAERGSGYSLPRLVCEDIATKPSLNGDFVTRGETRGIYIVAVLVVVSSCSVERSGKGVSRSERR